MDISRGTSGRAIARGVPRLSREKIRLRNNIRVLRAERRWSQAELAERIRATRQTINAIENGKYDPSLLLAFRLAIVFDVPIEHIFLYDVDDDT
jgi:putative transcriptional regulator